MGKKELDPICVPHSVEAEQSVLGSVLIDPVCFSVVQQVLQAQDFYLPQHQAIYEIMESRELRKQPIDPLTVLDALIGREEFDKAGGREYLYQMARSVPSTANVRSYAEIVREKARRRAGLQMTAEISEFLQSDTSTEEAERIAGELLQLLAKTDGGRIFSSAQLFRRFVERMKEPVRQIATGISKIDDYAQIDFGDYVVIGGRPSSGKTALTIQFMLDMAKKRRVVYFSLETNSDKIFDRAIANRCGTPLRTLKRHDLNDVGEREHIAASMENYMDDWKFHVVSAAGWTVEKVRAAAVQLKAEVIFVDYLGLLESSGKSLYEQVTCISKGLHTLAQTTGITVVALSQLSRSAKGEEVELEHLRESGQIEQDADVVLLLARPNERNEYGVEVPSQTTRLLRIAKNKDGESGVQIKLAFDGQTQQFSVIDDRRSEP